MFWFFCKENIFGWGNNDVLEDLVCVSFMLRWFDDIIELMFESCVFIEFSLGIEFILELLLFVFGFELFSVVLFLFGFFVKFFCINVFEDV